jgi:hypothetical protein
MMPIYGDFSWHLLTKGELWCTPFFLLHWCFENASTLFAWFRHTAETIIAMMLQKYQKYCADKVVIW